ncbi:MAG: 3-phosphoshikimate 1-carboxyvinyltransferase [Alphaproteobacteria bacterium]
MTGQISVPGDKSISHRALMFGALALGETKIHGLLEGEDVLRTAAALRLMGVDVQRLSPGEWCVHGVGVSGLAEPVDILDMGNAGTGTRLMMGIVAGHGFTSFFTGDASLRSRPMRRVAVPLESMGARIISRENGRPPLAVVGTAAPMAISYGLPVASAQVKSAILLCGLAAPGYTTVIEPEPTRDHTELLLRHFGAEIWVAPRSEGQGRQITLKGQPELRAAPVIVPGDISSAAFPIVAAAIARDAEIRIQGVGANPLRTGLLESLKEMGADLSEENRRIEAGEPVIDLLVRSRRLKGIEVPESRAPSMIDEYPILAVAAATAKGKTMMRGLAELRVKESDRLAAMVAGLTACGVKVEAGPDWLMVEGCDGPPLGLAKDAAPITTHLDHRIAMAFLVLGTATQNPIAIDDDRPIATSFPGFMDLMQGIGAKIIPSKNGTVGEF